MIFGDPYRFAIWVEHVPQWGEFYKNGLFYFVVNGHMYPDDVRTSTLNVDIYDVIDNENALITLPCNDEIFKSSTSDAFNTLMKLAYPESTEEDEYPEQVFDFCAAPAIITDTGAYFFVVSNEEFVRVIGGKVTKLVDQNDEIVCRNIDSPLIEDVTISKNEISEIITKLKEYSTSLF